MCSSQAAAGWPAELVCGAWAGTFRTSRAPPLLALAAGRFGANRVAPGRERPALAGEGQPVHEPTDAGAATTRRAQGEGRIAQVHAHGQGIAVAVLGGEDAKWGGLSRTPGHGPGVSRLGRDQTRGVLARPFRVLGGPRDAPALVPVARARRRGARQKPLVHAGAVGRRAQAGEPAHT